jgi:hypothetical protein
LKEAINQLQGDMEKLVSELSIQRPHQNQGWANYQSTEAAGPEQWICLEEYQEALVGPPFRKY